MKKLLAVILCLTALTACGKKSNDFTPPPPMPSGAPAMPNVVKAIIAPSDTAPIADSWTILGEVGLVIDGEYTDIILATEAKRGSDGYMMWDDSQKWRLLAIGETNSYTLFEEDMSGTAYIEASMEGENPSLKLITTSTAGLTVIEYTYSKGTFYSQKLVEPRSNGNRIYSSFPEYYE